MFGHDWVDGEGTIVAVRIVKTTGDGMVSTHEWAVDVRVAGHEPFRTVVGEPYFAMDFWPPRVGQMVRVHADVRRQEAKFDRDDPALSAKAVKAAMRASAQARFDAAAEAPPGS